MAGPPDQEKVEEAQALQHGVKVCYSSHHNENN
jgi:hypothetical protein